MSPVNTEWPPCKYAVFSDAHKLLQKIYHAWRVSSVKFYHIFLLRRNHYHQFPVTKEPIDSVYQPPMLETAWGYEALLATLHFKKNFPDVFPRNTSMLSNCSNCLKAPCATYRRCKCFCTFSVHEIPKIIDA